MWRFQLQAISEKKSFLLRLLTVSFVLHVLFLIIIFIGNRDCKVDVVKLNLHAAQIRFVPTFDAAKIAHSHRNPPKPTSIKKTSAITLTSSKKRVANSVSINKSNQKKSLQNGKVQENSKTFLQKKSLPKPKEKIVKKALKPLDKKEVKNERKVNSTYDFLPEYNKKFSINRIIPQLEQSSYLPIKKENKEKVEQPTIEKKNKVITETLKPVETIVPEIETPNTISETKSEVVEEVMYVSPREYNALMVHQDLQHALQLAWTPPPGVASHISAQITIVVGHKGAIQSLVFKKRSGSLVYDTSIEHALQKSVLPESIWSKTLTITFSP